MHAHGRVRYIDDARWLRAHLEMLTDQLDHLVGIEMPVDRLAGKRKVSQNRSQRGRQGVASGLRARGGPYDRHIAEPVGRGDE